MKKISISDYGFRHSFPNGCIAGGGRSRFLWISKNPKTNHSAYRLLKAIEKNEFRTRKFILKNEGMRENPNYWAELHRYDYIVQYKTDDNRIIYSLTEKGKRFIRIAEINSRCI